MTPEQETELSVLFQKVVQQFLRTKLHVKLAESFDPLSRVPIPPINEVRNASDHLVRYLIASQPPLDQFRGNLGISGSEFEYRRKNLESCINHLRRSSCDALDAASISIKETFQKFISKYEYRNFELFDPTIRELKNTINQTVQEAAELKTNNHLSQHGEDQDPIMQLMERLTDLRLDMEKRIAAVAKCLDAMERAGLVVGEVNIQIQQVQDGCSPDDIIAAFPDYFSKFVPRVNSLRRKLESLSPPDPENLLQQLLDSKEELASKLEAITSHKKMRLNNEARAGKKKTIRNIIAWAGGIVATVLATVIATLLLVKAFGILP